MFIFERLMRSLKTFERFSGGFFRGGLVELMSDSFLRFLCCGFVNFFDFGGQVVGIDILSRVVRSVKSFMESSYGLFAGTMVLSGGLR